MLMRRTWRYALGVLLIAALGCKGHPELSKTNDKNSSEWKHRQVNTLSFYWIASGNRVDTPGGEKIPELGITCDSNYHLMEVRVATASEPQTGVVGLGFDGGLSQKNWEIKPEQVKDRVVYTLKVPDADQGDLLGQFRKSKEFQFEFTPKGGQPQRTKFKLLNIGTLLDQDENCRKVAISVR